MFLANSDSLKDDNFLLFLDSNEKCFCLDENSLDLAHLLTVEEMNCEECFSDPTKDEEDAGVDHCLSDKVTMKSANCFLFA